MCHRFEIDAEYRRRRARLLAEKGTGFRSLGVGGADATTPHGRLMLTVLGGMVEFDREWILVLDVRMGPKPKLPLYQRHKALRR
ncbi:hypothetical protein Acry_3330 (plasmid) [Acidiphilium cryptum JF-5]|uniref:Resolvase/invertase-type recombinase catalytic domain-containing protein n=1 Tax=Acidiphilium cryptum (strain JF-5) TaxID=349163 RepID=A5FTL0_ACICJ|nr:hypothetical protein Acry_3330 [Acidiphilium cryptum JF-5]